MTQPLSRLAGFANLANHANLRLPFSAPTSDTGAVTDIATSIEREVASWPGVTVVSHGFGFVEFHVGRRELGHLHGNRLADVPFPVRIREQLVAAGKAAHHHNHPESGWISFYFSDEHDVERALELFRLNYERPWLTGSDSRLTRWPRASG